jgi:hypothetical protein
MRSADTASETTPTKKEGVMINRRIIIASAAALAFTASAASAQDWKTKYPEITFAVVPAENASGVTERFTPFVAYLSKELGIKVNLRIANDYAAVIEGQRAGNIQLAYYGPASFARARVTGVKTDAFAIDVNADGSKGYFSVFYVLAKSPYQQLSDLKGKNLGLVDPNSTSGNNMPRFKMNQMGVDPDSFHRQPRERRAGAGAGHGRRRRQLVECGRRFQPDPHAGQEHGQVERRHAAEKGRLPRHREVGSHHQLALCLSQRSARGHEGRHQAGLPRRAAEGQGRFQEAVRRQEPAVADHHQ